MALQKQLVPLSFAQGLEKKSDPKQVVPGKMLELENCIFTKNGQYTKRNGHENLGRSGTTASACTNYLNELVTFDGLNVRSLAQSLDSFTDKGQALSLEVESLSVVANGYTQSSMDGAFHDYGLKVFAWEDSRGGVRYSVLDALTSQVIVSDSVVFATGVRPKVFALGNYIIITYYNGTNLVFKSFAVNAPQTLSTAVDLATDVNSSNPNYDATVIGTRLFWAYNTNNMSSSIAVNYMDSNLNIATAYEEVGDAASVCLTIFSDSFENAWVAFYNGSKVRAFVVSYSLGSVAAATDVATVANIRNITGIMTVDTVSTAGTATLLYESSATLTYNYFTTLCTVARSTSTLTPGTPAVFLRSVGLASKLFAYNDEQYVALAYQSTLQPTYFVSTLDRLIVAKMAALNAGGLTAKSILPEVSMISDSEFQIALGKKNSLEVEAGTLFSSTGVIGSTLSFLSTNTYLRATASNDLHITGGFLSMYDGVSVVEHGFHLFPETSTITQATSTGGIQAGTFQYCVVYEWKDNQGNIHYSAPSEAQTVVVPTGGTLTFTADTTSGSVTLTSVSALTNLFVGQLITGTGIPANTFITAFPSGSTITMSNAATATNSSVTISTIYTNKVTLAIPTLRITAKQAPRANVILGVYRTQANLQTFYKVSSISSPTVNSTTADTVSFVDTTPDLYLTGNELLYTTGGVVENISAPACSLITNFKDYVVVVPSESENEYWISKEVVSGQAVAFTDLFVKQVSPFGGKISAVWEMDEKLILFKRACTMITAGDGPNNTGQQDSLAKPQLVTTDVGCTNQRSVVTMPLGVMFQSTKGMYLLDRSLNAVYIGADVEAYNDLNITSAQLIPNTNQVRFTSVEGTTLVYDYFVKQWSVFTKIEAVDSAIFENQFTYIDPRGNVWKETPGQYLDGAAPIKIKIRTSWLSFAGLLGFQRIYQMMILGEYKSLHKLIVSIAYDFNPNPTQQTYINAGSDLQPLASGEISPYGGSADDESNVYGGAYPLYQYRVDMDIQKCEAIQFILEEVPLPSYGEGLSLSGFTTLVGIKQGLYKIPANRQVA